jgi:hypothetical protein
MLSPAEAERQRQRASISFMWVFGGGERGWQQASAGARCCVCWACMLCDPQSRSLFSLLSFLVLPMVTRYQKPPGLEAALARDRELEAKKKVSRQPGTPPAAGGARSIIKAWTLPTNLLHPPQQQQQPTRRSKKRRRQSSSWKPALTAPARPHQRRTPPPPPPPPRRSRPRRPPPPPRCTPRRRPPSPSTASGRTP